MTVAFEFWFKRGPDKTIPPLWRPSRISRRFALRWDPICPRVGRSRSITGGRRGENIGRSPSGAL